MPTKYSAFKRHGQEGNSSSNNLPLQLSTSALLCKRLLSAAPALSPGRLSGTSLSARPMHTGELGRGWASTAASAPSPLRRAHVGDRPPRRNERSPPL